jgi:hypothetical protein
MRGHSVQRRGDRGFMKYVKYDAISMTSSNTSCPRLLVISAMMGNITSSSAGSSSVSVDTESSSALSVRMQPKAAMAAAGAGWGRGRG